MKNRLLAAMVLILLPLSAGASDLQKELKSRWLGSWVVMRVEGYSACQGNYTNNRINGNLVKSNGGHAFASGELAKLDKVDAKRSRLDLMLTLAEPVLVSYQEGPFTLYREAQCRIELEVEIPRHVVKSKDVASIEAMLAQVVERFASADEARASNSYNERERDSYPDDYDATLAELAVWRAETTNAQVRAKLDGAHDVTQRLIDRVSGDNDYLAGFADGVERARAMDLRACPALLRADLEATRHRSTGRDDDRTEEQKRADRGYDDGRAFVLSLEMIRRLPGCLVEVPDPPGTFEAAVR